MYTQKLTYLELQSPYLLNLIRRITENEHTASSSQTVKTQPIISTNLNHLTHSSPFHSLTSPIYSIHLTHSPHLLTKMSFQLEEQHLSKILHDTQSSNHVEKYKTKDRC